METKRAKIYSETEDVDVLSECPTTQVRGKDLREGMVLVDTDFNTPSGLIDHKVGRAKQGQVTFMINDLVNGGWVTVPMTANKLFTVVAET